MHMGATIVDSLSTLWIMGLHSEFAKATEWVVTNLTFNHSDTFVSLFEVNIRILGGLLSAYELSNNTLFLNKAVELGELMQTAFQIEGFPYTYYNFLRKEGKTRRELRFLTSYGPIYGQAYFSLAEVGTFSLEFSALSYHTQNAKYKSSSDFILSALSKQYKTGLKPNGVYLDGSSTGIFSAAGEGDSYYEYLVKEYIHTGLKDKALREEALEALLEVVDNLVQQDVSGLYYLGIMKDNEVINRMDHLSCFLPGLIIIALAKLEPPGADRLFNVAKELAFTCFNMYEQSVTGLSSESVYLEFGIKYPWLSDTHFALRPEALESFWYLYYVTKDKSYRDYAWSIFLAIEKHAKNEVGYAEISDVNQAKPEQRGCLPSYFFSETLKYLYMIFSDSPVIDLDQWVLNTEGHPLRIKRDFPNVSHFE
jgi:mannosyl-oligosaccharide alpha-1,2-mannosidase